MKTLCQKTEYRTSKGELDLIIKYNKGTSTIVSNHNSHNYHQNIRGLLKKIIFLLNFLLNVNYDIICVNESWLNNNVFEVELAFIILIHTQMVVICLESLI